MSEVTAEGYIWPWESVPAAKMLGFANFNEVAAATLEKKAPTLFSLFNVAEICSFLKPSPVQQKKLRASQDTNIMTFCSDLMAHHKKT